MTPVESTSRERWQRLTELFHGALERPASDRARFLDDACADDSALRADVERLVAAYERSGNFEQPAIAVVSDSLTTLEFGESAVGRRIGPYRVVRPVGRGGMGAVYLAERADGQFEHRVAIKLIKRGMDTDLVLQRFRSERQILASLEHANIARLLDGGTTDDGRPYVVMEYIDGQPIDAYAKARALSVPERLQLFLRVCAAVEYAHRHHVVHRDIKPSNILVTTDGEPKLLDFGIAKVLTPGDGEPTTAVTGMRILTPEYASPEQVNGHSATPGSDVYSLGVVLYELLSGRSPYRLNSRDSLEIADAVRTWDPERPSAAVSRPTEPDDLIVRGGAERLRRSLRGDLDTIVLTALRKEPERRYQRVDQLADDIERHLDGRPVSARPDTLRYRTGKFARRNRAAIAAAGAAAVVVAAFGATVVAFTPRASPVAGAPLTPRDRVLVADFADRAGDPSLAAALTEAFRVDLTQSPVLQVLSPRQVRSTLVRMERSPDLALDDSVAREVAQREAVKAFVTGSVSKVAGRYTISAQLIGAQMGDLLVAERETAPDSLDVIGALDRLSRRLRERMGESLKSVRATPPLEQVTTPSLAALRLYSEATRANVAGDRKRARELMQRAVAIDTGFASGYRSLALFYGDDLEPAREATAIAHALANQARLPFLERYLMIAVRASGPLGDLDAAIDAYRRVLDRYPDDVRALNNLAYMYSFRRQFAAQESLVVRAIAVDSTIPTMYTQLAMAQVNSGDLAAARHTLDRVERRFPGFFNAQLAEIYLASARQDWTAAERHARERLMIHPADTSDALGGERVLAEILATQGRLVEAERYFRHELAMSAAAPGERADYLGAAILLGSLQLRYRHAPNDALRTVDDAIARFPLDSVPEADRPFDDLARFYAAAGRPARARTFAAAADRSPFGRRPSDQPGRRWSLGTIALAEGRAHDAVVQLRIAADSLSCPICALPDLARAYDAAGQPDSAIAVAERYLRTPWEWRFETDDFELGATLRRLADAYDRRGDRAKSAAMNERLRQLWRNAEPALTASAPSRETQGAAPPLRSPRRSDRRQ